MSVPKAFNLAFLVSSICIFLLIHYFFEWDFILDIFRPKNWRSYKMKKMREKRDTPLSHQGLSKDKREALEAMLIPLTKRESSLLPAGMDKTFRAEMEHQIRLLQEKHLKREFYFAGISCPENFVKWNDGGREWREIELDASVLEKFVNDSGDTVQEIYHSHAAMMCRQSQRIRHDDRQEKKRQYYEDTVIYCRSCGAEVSLNAQEVYCPYCGAVIAHQFFDWQTESLDFYDKMGNTCNVSLITLRLWGFIFLTSGIGFSLYHVSRFITSFFLFIAFALPISIIWFGDMKQTKLQKQIVRYSESYLRTCINEALWQKEDKSDLLSFSVNYIKLMSVQHRDEMTHIKLQSDISKTFLKDASKPIIKKEKVTLCMKRAQNPSRIKNKGKIFFERDCPSCGANFMPDENNNCSYCGYGLHVYNGKWKIEE